MKNIDAAWRLSGSIFYIVVWQNKAENLKNLNMSRPYGTSIL